MIGVEWLTSRLAHVVICVSPSVLELGERERILPRGKSVVLGRGSCGVNVQHYQRAQIDSTRLEALRRELGISGRAIVIGFVGRLIPRKGIAELMEAWQAIKVAEPHTRLLLVGPLEEGQQLGSEVLDRINKDDGIIVTGFVNDVPNYLALMDIFALPAHWEGFGNVLVEAAAMGVPVVATTGTGTCDAVSHGYNGLLVPVRDSVALAEALLSYVRDPNLRERHGRAGVKWSRHFARELIWTELDRLYSEHLETAGLTSVS